MKFLEMITLLIVKCDIYLFVSEHAKAHILLFFYWIVYKLDLIELCKMKDCVDEIAITLLSL